MKWTLVLGFGVLVSLMSRVSSADLGHTYAGFEEADDDLVEKAYRLLIDNGVGEEEIGDVLLSSWLSNAVSDVGSWTKKAAHDAADWTKQAAKDAAKYAKTGCHYVNQVPFKELVLRGSQELRKQGMSAEEVGEAQVVSGLIAGAKGVKAACGLLG